MNWLLTIELSDVWQDEQMSFEEKRNEITHRIRYSNWRKLTVDPDSLDGLLEVLGATTGIAPFEAAFGEIYDLADEDGIWIETHGKVVKL